MKISDQFNADNAYFGKLAANILKAVMENTKVSIKIFGGELTLTLCECEFGGRDYIEFTSGRDRAVVRLGGHQDFAAHLKGFVWSVAGEKMEEELELSDVIGKTECAVIHGGIVNHVSKEEIEYEQRSVEDGYVFEEGCYTEQNFVNGYACGILLYTLHLTSKTRGRAASFKRAPKHASYQLRSANDHILSDDIVRWSESEDCVDSRIHALEELVAHG